MKILNECGEKLLKPWCSVQNWALGISTLYLITLAVRTYDLKSSDIAAWVQAIGALVSIWAVWSIARQESKRSELEARRADVAKCSAVVGVLRHAFRVVYHEPYGNEGTVQVTELATDIGRMVDALDRLDVLMLPDDRLITAVFESKHVLERLQTKVRNYESSVYITEYYRRGAASMCLKVITAQLKACEAVIDELSA
ncbi:hypothetical protein [Pseudomonas putida]